MKSQEKEHTSQEKEQVQSPLPQAQAEHHCRKFVDHVRIIIKIALAPNQTWLCVYTFEI